ncbi:hypothetical protein [Kitasatospora sp. NPDC089509]|uniref:hypothetical protein n=1 Tax=Kitasatospora sp. NPDC089509 TaxID=3364079 RepID=UPI0037F91696
MTEPAPLIVPIDVDALLVNSSNVDDVHSRTPDFHALAEHGPADPGNTHPAEPGVYVQWQLPIALRTGHIDPTGPGGMRFPLIPNRWLVIRHSFTSHPDGSTTPPPDVRSWLLRGDEPAVDDSAAVLPGRPEGGGFPRNARYGRAHPLGTGTPLPEEPATKPFLTVDSTGLPAFAQYGPYNRNILSFHDTQADLEAVPNRANGHEITVSYLVVGWYSDRSADPLGATTAKDLPARLASLHWTLPKDVPVQDPAGTLYVGRVLGLPWTADLDPAHLTFPDGGPVDLEGRPPLPTVTLAVGHSTVEAATALFAQDDLLTPDDAALFEAFCYDLLDASNRPHLPEHDTEPALDHALDYARHTREFRALPGGHRWHLTAVEPTAGLPAAPVPLSDKEQQTLDDLNRAQARLDGLVRRRKDLVTRLKGLWWITSPYDRFAPNPPQQGVNDSLRSLAARIADLDHGIKDCVAALPADTTPRGLTDWGGKHGIDTAHHRLQPTPLPAFHAPANPVVTVSHLQDRRRSREHDGFLGGPLPVRPATALPSATAPAFPLPDTSPTSFDAVRPQLPGLAAEFSAQLAGVTEAVRTKGGQARDTDLTAVTPDLPYVRWWHQPWLPVILEWEADLYPAEATDWAFAPGTPALSRYTHVSRTPRTDARATAVRRTVSGHTYIQPLLEAHARYRLQHAAAVSPDPRARDAHQGLFDRITANEWDVQSFTLAGVNETLACRRPDIGLRTRSADAPGDTDDLTYAPPTSGYVTPPQSVLAARTGHLPRTAETPILAGRQDKAALGDRTFPQQRAAQLCLTSLTITDSFGRTISPLVKDQGHITVRAPSLTVTDATRSYAVDGQPASDLVDLPPRLHQGARLRFDLLDAATRVPLVELDTPDSGDPVHGWILATRSGRRHSLLCYEPDGRPLFDLHCIDAGVARCRPLPGSRYTGPHDTPAGTPWNATAPLRDFAADHPALAAFLKPLVPAPGSGGNGALAALLDSVQQGLDTITPPAPRTADRGNLAFALGRPCALMTARLRLELDGPPLPAATPEALGNPKPTVAPATRRPVLLGDPHLVGDGLLGYFTHPTATGPADHSRFHTHHPADPAGFTLPPSAEDITLVAQDITRATDTDHPEAPEDTLVTLLACPHNSVQAVTDIVPAVSLTLPPAHTDRALARIRTAFPLGPVLAPVPSGQRTDLIMPQPEHGTWTWAEPTAPTAWTTHGVTSPRPTDQAPGHVPEAHTGYLLPGPGDPVAGDHGGR